MNIYLLIILGLLLFNYVFNVVLEWLNLRHAAPTIPKEFEGVYDEKEYTRSQNYLRTNTRFELISSSIQLPIQIAFILLGGFYVVDEWAKSAGLGLIGTGLLFAGILMLLGQLLNLPFSLYQTFVIEERFGFNRTSLKTFFSDLLKGLILSMLIGGSIYAGILWFFDTAGSNAWWYSWIAVVVVQLILVYLAPVYIMPLFNKFEPLEDGELRSEIESYAQKEGFALQGIFTMDGSKRSSKANAYFTGFGKMRRIVLFDTLIEKQSVKELVAVLAHEVGHFKLKHIVKMLVSSILSTGLMFFILSLFISRPGLYEAFGVEGTPLYAGFVFFGFLYSPISMILSIFGNVMSRKHEFEADAFAAQTTGNGEDLISALKKLSVDSLSNLTPHPLKVFIEYSHPPVLERIRALKRLHL